MVTNLKLTQALLKCIHDSTQSHVVKCDLTLDGRDIPRLLCQIDSFTVCIVTPPSIGYGIGSTDLLVTIMYADYTMLLRAMTVRLKSSLDMVNYHRITKTILKRSRWRFPLAQPDMVDEICDIIIDARKRSSQL